MKPKPILLADMLNAHVKWNLDEAALNDRKSFSCIVESLVVIKCTTW